MGGGGGGGRGGKKSAIQKHYADSFDQVSNRFDDNHVVISPIKTKSMTIATKPETSVVTLTARSRSTRGRI